MMESVSLEHEKAEGGEVSEMKHRRIEFMETKIS